MKRQLAPILALVLAPLLCLAAGMLGCGTASGGGNAFIFTLDVVPESGRVGTIFAYSSEIDIVHPGATLENLRIVDLSIPSALELVKVGNNGVLLNGQRVAIEREWVEEGSTHYSFNLGDVSTDPSSLRFECRGVSAGEQQVVALVMQADGTNKATRLREVGVLI